MPDLFIARRGRIEDRGPVEHPLAFREGSGRLLGEESDGAVERLIDACREDVQLAIGGAPEVDEARHLLREPLPGVAREQRLPIGLFDAGGELAALLDAYRDFPRAGSWYLALLLVRPDQRGRGVGSGLMSRLERLALGAGAAAIDLIAPSRNPGILQFLRRVGFEQRREVSLPLGERALRGFHFIRELTPGLPAPAGF